MYGFVVTTIGETMLARASAGELLTITGVAVGKGVAVSVDQAKALTALIDQVAAATSTAPVVASGQISMIVEYRNDLGGGLREGFDLSEFGVSASVGDDEPALLYYGGLGDHPQPIQPISEGLDIHRFPVAVEITGEVTVNLGYPTGALVTHEELDETLEGLPSLGPDGKIPASQLPAMNYDPAGSAAAVQANLSAHTGNNQNPHAVTAAQVGAAVTFGPVTVTVPAANWSGSGPWTQTVSVAGVTAADNNLGIYPVDVADNDARKLYEKAYGCLAAEADTVAGGITLICRDARPEIDFQIIVKGVR